MVFIWVLKQWNPLFIQLAWDLIYKTIRLGAGGSHL
jgi:hypothetical protein